MTRAVELFRRMVAQAQCNHRCMECIKKFNAEQCPIIVGSDNKRIDHDEYRRFMRSMIGFANMMVLTRCEFGDWTPEDIVNILKEEELCD